MKWNSRIILKTIDGKTIVRPEAKKGWNEWVEFENVRGCLNDEGIEAWNKGDKLEWWHFSSMIDNRIILHANI